MIPFVKSIWKIPQNKNNHSRNTTYLGQKWKMFNGKIKEYYSIYEIIKDIHT